MATSLVQGLTQSLAPVDVPLIERRHLNFSGVTYEGDTTEWDTSGAGQYLGSLGSVSTPYAYFIESVTVTANRTLRGRLTWGFQDTTDGSGSPPLTDGQFIVPHNGSVTIPTGLLLRGSLEGAGNLRITAYLDEVNGGDETLGVGSSIATTVTAFATGYAFADDFDFSADKPLLFIGDSTWNGTGADAKTDFIPWRIRKYYSDQGFRTRMILGTQSGSTTAFHSTVMQLGQYDHGRLGGIFVNLGINDAAQGLSASDAKDNITNLINWKKARYPDIPMVVFGPTPVENNTWETLLGTMRTNYSDAVTAAGDSNVKYMSLAGAFNRATSGNYVGSDPGGSRVHPNAATMGAIWNGGYSGFGGIKAWLDANLPTC